MRRTDPNAAPMPFDAATQVILDQAAYEALRKAADQNAHFKADRDRWYNDCLKAEAALKLEEQRHLNTTKDKIELARQLAALTAKPRRTAG